MAENEEQPKKKGERKILTPATWFAFSFIFWSIILIPLSVGFFYILKVSVRLFELDNNYSILFGLGVGLVLSLIVGYIYSNKARKLAE
ncbi:MAG: hypothetical protein U9R75_09290 [Candidatus Thermoplasmatota archaeon]|nr:hypothetical protein [Candidatus Thermoplasmatota archaeon]